MTIAAAAAAEPSPNNRYTVYTTVDTATQAFCKVCNRAVTNTKEHVCQIKQRSIEWNQL